VCFVAGDNDESRAWEHQLLNNAALAGLHDAVVLRLTAGSDEAAYLSAIVPLPHPPTVVAISVGLPAAMCL